MARALHISDVAVAFLKGNPDAVARFWQQVKDSASPEQTREIVRQFIADILSDQIDASNVREIAERATNATRRRLHEFLRAGGRSTEHAFLYLLLCSLSEEYALPSAGRPSLGFRGAEMEGAK